jgi:hypothetical protein
MSLLLLYASVNQPCMALPFNAQPALAFPSGFPIALKTPIAVARSKPSWKSECAMRAETLLRKLRLQEALCEDELTTYLGKLKPDGSLPPSDALILLEMLGQRTARLSIEDIKAVSSLVSGNCPSTNETGFDEGQAKRAIISNLSK